MKQFVALARVSSREQEREGFSLEVQEEALRRYATQAGGEIAKLFRIAETASKADERKTFRELVAYAKKKMRPSSMGCSSTRWTVPPATSSITSNSNGWNRNTTCRSSPFPSLPKTRLRAA